MILAAILLAATTTKPITAVWAARRDFGPQVRGALRIERDGTAWRAEIAGRSAEVTVDHDNLSFALPNGQGSFRGAIRGERIAGHWVQPPAVSSGLAFATPVTLTRRSPMRWSGTVAPIDDHMTLFLPVMINPDGTYQAFLRNPERNIGRFVEVQRLTLDGAHVKLFGKGDGALAEGTYDAENDVLSLSFPGAGGTFDFHRVTPAEDAEFYPRGHMPLPYVYRKPLDRGDGWPVATVDEVGISRDGIVNFISKLIMTQIDSTHVSDVHGVLVARHGKLVVEEYFHGTNPDEPHDTRSASKSITSVLAGAAKVDPSTRVYRAMGVKTDDPRKEAMTLEHLLTMSSGLDCDDNDDNSPGNENVMQSQTAQPDWYRYTLDLENIRKPGEKSVYCSCQSNLAGGVIGRKSGRWLPDLFRDLLAEPLQIERYGINLMPTGEAYMGGGMRLLPRDFMKLGQVMLDGGRWKGRQIVSAEWAKKSTSEQTKIGDRMYGDLWWLADYPYNGRKVRAFFAAGNGGQIVMGIPDLDLVIAFYGGNYGEAAAAIPQRVFVPEDILPAVK